MHPTDTLLSLSHARIARAAAAGPRRATQPTALTDRQHLARLDETRSGVVTFTMGEGAIGGGGGGQSGPIPWMVFGREVKPGETVTIIVGKAGGAGSCLEADTLNTLARADGILAQRIDEI